MELINWSLNAIDKIISTRSSGAGEPACPDGSLPAGYVADAWGKWGAMCLAPLSAEDVEDLYIFGLLFVGLALIGTCSGLTYWKLKGTAFNIAQQVATLTKKWITDAGDRNAEVSRRMDILFGMIAELNRKVDNIERRGLGSCDRLA